VKPKLLEVDEDDKTPESQNVTARGAREQKPSVEGRGLVRERKEEIHAVMPRPSNLISRGCIIQD
jgi:hypothetical protein